MQAWADILICGLCIPKYWGSCSVLHFRGRIFQSDLLCCLEGQVSFPRFCFSPSSETITISPWTFFSVSPGMESMALTITMSFTEGLAVPAILNWGADDASMTMLSVNQSWSPVQWELLSEFCWLTVPQQTWFYNFSRVLEQW